MNEELLEKVLSCPKLPSVPAVAMRVIELTADQNVSMRQLAETIQNDQGLAMRILKTVNSPFYGLAKRCSTIGQAQLMLGLNGVKTLALGFSLVTSIKQEAEAGFNYVAYWRRAVYSAVASRSAARMVKCPCAEEAFLGGLLQDIGMIALYRALGEEYLEILRAAGAVHSDLSRLEVERLELSHAEVGAMLAERWRLPDTLVAPVRFHERATAAPPAHQAVVRCVALGISAAEALTRTDSPGCLAQFRKRAAEWLELTPAQADELLKAVGASATELSALLSVSTGPQANVQEILERAQEQLVTISLERGQQSDAVLRENAELQIAAQTDSLTGVASRHGFRQSFSEVFARASKAGEPMSLALVDPDSLRRINADHGWEIGDALLKALARRLNEHFRPYRGVVGRIGADEFGVLLDRCDRSAAGALLQAFCDSLAAAPLDLEGCDLPPGTIAITASAGLVTLDASNAALFSRIEQLVHAADQALHAAQGAGGNCIRIFSAKAKAAA